MDTKKFLELTVPNGTMCIADHITFDDGKKAFVHYPFTDKAKAAQFATWLDGKGSTVYYALATYKETFQNDKGKERLKRTVKNVAELKSIWLDIDFKDCPAEELVPKLGTFIRETGMPKPSMIVNSGGGLHVYWCCHDAMELDMWVPLAEGLKKLCKEHDLPADHVCTSDAARVLRPVGTHNRKNGEKEVRLVAGDGHEYSYEALLAPMPKVETNDLPAHLRGHQVDSEYSNTGFPQREVDTKTVIKNCAVLRNTLQTGGAECSEPEWNSILLLLRFLPDGAKFVHPMSQGHIDYSKSATMDKWQQKLEADVTGPPLCTTLEQYGHTAKCQGCPIYKSKRAKTPLALGYVDGSKAPTPKLEKSSTRIVSPTHSYPRGWRDLPGNQGVERRIFDKSSGEWEWEKVLNRTWRLEQARKSINTGIYSYMVTAKFENSKPVTLEVPGSELHGNQYTWQLLSEKGAPLTSNEQTHWKDLMATWLRELQNQNAEIETTDQLGWIERLDDTDSRTIVGFASGGGAFFNDGTKKTSIVAANAKHTDLAAYYTPMGSIDKWNDVFEFYKEQGLQHVMVMIASAFAGPLIKFTPQDGTIMSVVSSGSAAGKSLALQTATAVWGDPKRGTITLDDTVTVAKNKVAFLQNITTYWDEVRGNNADMERFLHTAFQITQGRDKERANRSAKTIAAQTWNTMLVCASNESISELAQYSFANMGGDSGEAGFYRIFEVYIDAEERPKHDSRIPDLVSQLHNHYGRVGEKYAEYLAKNQKKVVEVVKNEFAKWTDHMSAAAPERFWVATCAALTAGALLAEKAGVAEFDRKALYYYLMKQYKRLRLRAKETTHSLDPKELLNAYMMQHQDGRLVVDALRTGPGGQYEPQIIGNFSHIRKLHYQIGKDQNILRVSKTDFKRWLDKTRNLKLTHDIAARFVRDCNMREVKATLGLGTQFTVGQRGVCLDFDLDNAEWDDE